MRAWPVQDAEARFVELLEASLKEGPQLVTQGGIEAAVLIPVAEWRRLQQSARPTLKDLLLTDEARGDIRLCELGAGPGAAPRLGRRRELPARDERRLRVAPAAPARRGPRLARERAGRGAIPFGDHSRRASGRSSTSPAGRDPAKAAEIEGWIDRVEETYSVLPLDARTMRVWSRLMHRRSDDLVERRDDGGNRAGPLPDSTVTRNSGDFEAVGRTTRNAVRGGSQPLEADPRRANRSTGRRDHSAHPLDHEIRERPHLARHERPVRVEDGERHRLRWAVPQDRLERAGPEVLRHFLG